MKYKGTNIDNIGILSTPSLYLELCGKLFIDLLKYFKKLMLTKGVFVIIAIFIWILLSTIDSLNSIRAFILFALYWVALGVASSIGLGTGLHTFVLYLGPHIAKVAIIATSCGYLPAMVPSRWEFEHFAQCEDSTENMGFFAILIAVQVESFLWGFGTALGELPPYFVSKKASQTRLELIRMNKQSDKNKEEEEEKLNATGNDDEKKETSEQNGDDKDQSEKNDQSEIDQVMVLKNTSPDKLKLIDRAKIFIYDNLEKYGFVTILLCASIPNPLFDLAGITCGHFRIPFKTFFTATMIGKAIIKVHLQMIFVITIFRKETLNQILEWVGSISKSLSVSIKESLDKNKAVFHEPTSFQENKPLLSRLWDLFIIGMIGYFLISILNGQVQEKAIELRDKN